MAVKAMFAVTGFYPDTNGNYRCLLHIWQGDVHAEGVVNDVDFSTSTLSATINAALKGFVEGYIQSTWGVVFNTLLDSVKLLNPVSLV